MPAPLLSGTVAFANSMFSIVVLGLRITQIAFHSALTPPASSFGRPPTPRSVSPDVDITHTSPVYVAASISMTSFGCATAIAAHGVLYVRVGPARTTLVVTNATVSSRLSATWADDALSHACPADMPVATPLTLAVATVLSELANM